MPASCHSAMKVIACIGGPVVIYKLLNQLKEGVNKITAFNETDPTQC